MIHPRKNSVRDKVIGKKWIYLKRSTLHRGFPGGSEGKESARNAGDLGSVPGFSPWVGYGYPLRYSHLENSRDRGAWQASPWG